MEHDKQPIEGIFARMTATDVTFLASMMVLAVGMVLLGRINEAEGLKTERAKANGEAWIKWFSEAGESRFSPDYSLDVCAGSPLFQPKPEGAEGASTPDAANNDAPAVPAMRRPWKACFEALMAPGGPMADQVNLFTGAVPLQAAKCEPTDRKIIGAIVIEKVTPTPPGSAVPTVATPLAPSDNIWEKGRVRVTVCDKGGYPIPISEVDF